MDTIESLVTKLRKKRVRLYLEDDQLRYADPDGAMDEALRAELTYRHRDIYAYIGQKKTAARAAPTVISRHGLTDYPLSYGQERLWFLDRLGLVASVYNMPFALKLDGALDIEALKSSFKEVVRRHEIFRTRIKATDGHVAQAVDAATSFEVEVVDLRSLDQGERAAEATRLRRAEVEHKFELTVGPLFRVSVLRLGDEENLVLMTMHHSIFDGWSTGVLLRELGQLYRAFASGNLSPLEDLPIQYGDYAMWQRTERQEEGFKRELEYWKKQLSGIPESLELPTDRAHPPVASFRGNTVSFRLPTSLTKSLLALARSANVTPFMLTLAAFQALLFRWSGQKDIVVGSPIAGRTQRETEGLIGFFVNTLALRMGFSDDLSVLDLLRRVKDTTLDAYAHQSAPFERLVSELHPTRDLARQPIFQVIFALQNMPEEDLALPGVKVSGLSGDHITAKFDLALSLEDSPAGMNGILEYATDLFDRETIERLAGYFRTLLEGIVANPDCKVSELPLLSERERQTLLVDWNATAADYPRDKCVHSLFEEQAARSPEAVAVVYEGEELTYGELDRRSNQLAHYLRGFGVGPETIVALCVDRSLEMVVGLLGILKAGGAYLPIDPEYPAERISFMLSDAAAPVLLTQAKFMDRLSGGDQDTICLDRDWNIIGALPATPIVNLAQPDNLAYVIYTSGSTGKPKGVMIQHRSVVNFLLGMTARPGLSSLDHVAAATPISFDISGLEIWLPLINGACTAIVPRRIARDGSALLRYLEEHSITLFQGTPTTWRLLQEANGRIPQQSKILVGGEALTEDLALNLIETGTAIWNMYGPTETTIWSTSCNINLRTIERSISIGKPIVNTQVYVLGESLEVLPIGQQGELYIAGDGVSRGYFNRPALTAEKFVACPFGPPGSRMYRTGDRAKWRADGELEFIGRLDNQIKIRGFRIELGEIENALCIHPSLQHAAVAVATDDAGSRQLVAYVIPKLQQELDLASLKEHLKTRLPDYMVPTQFIALDTLPLTPNGKVDRNALPKPTQLNISDYTAPKTDLQFRLAQIWADVLKVERVGLLDNFFDLGGDSLSTIKLVAKINKAGLPCAVAQIFDNQTIEELTRSIDFSLKKQSNSPASAPLAIDQSDPHRVPITPIQRFYLDTLSSDVRSHYSIYQFEANQRLTPDAIEGALKAVIAHHDALNFCFTDSEGWRQQESSNSPDAHLQIFDISLQNEEAQNRSRESLWHQLLSPMDISSPPLIRAALIEMGSAVPQELIFVVHHLISDNVSHAVLREDFEAAYVAILSGSKPQLGAKTLSFKDWGNQLLQYYQSVNGESELSYWNSLPWDAATIPTDYEGEDTYSAIRSLTLRLSNTETEALLHLQKRDGLQMEEILLSALAEALASWTKRSQFLVCRTTHGRSFKDADVSRTIGWFTSIVPTLLEAPPYLDKSTAFEQVRKAIRQVPNNGLGFGVLKYMCGKSLPPMPLVYFDYQGKQGIRSQRSLLSPISRRLYIDQERYGHAKRAWHLEFGAVISEGSLSITAQYGGELYRKSTIEILLNEMLISLGQLAIS